MQAKFIALNGFIVCLYRNYRQSILKLAQNIKPTMVGGYISIYPAFLSNYAFYLQTQCPSLIAPYQLKSDLNINVF